MQLLGWVMLCAILLLSFHISVSGNLVSQAISSVATENPGPSSTIAAPLVATSLAGDPAASTDPKISTPAPKAESSAVFSFARSAAPRSALATFEVVKSDPLRSFDDDRKKKKIWYGLVVAGHAGAALDAWSTRRALSGNYGTEGDPIMRPFAHSNVLYFVTQVTPTVLDYVGRRAMSSRHPWVRRFWWVPQTTGAALSFGAGAHNISIVP